MQQLGTCSFCGHELHWENDEMDEDERVIHLCVCPFYGASVESYECPDGEKHNYPFWKQ